MGQHQIKRLQYTQEALADVLLARPDLSNSELAEMFDKSKVWVSYVKNSDIFKAYMAEKRKQVIHPILTANFDDKLAALADQSIDVLMEKISGIMPDTDTALECLKISSKAMGYGLKDNSNTAIQNNFIVAVPNKIRDPEEWARVYQGGGLEAPKAKEIQPTEAGE